VKALARADSRGTRGDLGPAEVRAFCQDASRFLLDRDTAETSLQPQALSDLFIEVSDDDRCHGDYFAAIPAISTKYFGAARRASTVARAGGFAGSIHASHTLFMSSK
jgi:hypothetical protein